MKPGPPPIPTKLKLLRGNPGKQKLNKREPKPPASLPSCPAHLGRIAKQEWRRICKQLHAVGLITQLDRAGVAAYCIAWARWFEAEQKIRKLGAVVKSPNGWPMQNPYLAIANKAMRQMTSYLNEFGMTPAARTRIEVKPGDPTETASEQLRRQARSWQDQ